MTTLPANSQDPHVFLPGHTLVWAMDQFNTLLGVMEEMRKMLEQSGRLLDAERRRSAELERRLIESENAALILRQKLITAQGQVVDLQNELETREGEQMRAVARAAAQAERPGLRGTS